MPKIATPKSLLTNNSNTERRKQKKRSSAAKKYRHDPLHVDILGMDDDDDDGDNGGDVVEENVALKKKEGKDRKRRKKGFDQSLQEKIIRAAVMQQEELEKEENSIGNSSDDEIQDDKMDTQEGFGTYDYVDGEDGEEEEEEEILELDESDVQLLDSFFSGGMQQQQQQPRQLDLSAMILEKIREREFLEGKDQQQVTQSEEDIKERIHPKVYEAYRKYVICCTHCFSFFSNFFYLPGQTTITTGINKGLASFLRGIAADHFPRHSKLSRVLEIGKTSSSSQNLKSGHLMLCMLRLSFLHRPMMPSVSASSTWFSCRA